MKTQLSFPALLAAFLLFVGLLMGIVSALMENPWALALAGIVTLSGVGWTILALRDDS